MLIFALSKSLAAPLSRLAAYAGRFSQFVLLSSVRDQWISFLEYTTLPTNRPGHVTPVQNTEHGSPMESEAGCASGELACRILH